MTGIPLQQEADTDNPETALGWALVGLPFDGVSVPMVVQPKQYEEWSKQLWDIGLRFHPEHQKLKYQPPTGSELNWVMGSVGEWVPVDKPLPPEVTAPDTSHLSRAEKQIILERLTKEFEQDTTEHNYAEVVK